MEDVVSSTTSSTEDVGVVDIYGFPCENMAYMHYYYSQQNDKGSIQCGVRIGSSIFAYISFAYKVCHSHLRTLHLQQQSDN